VTRELELELVAHSPSGKSKKQIFALRVMTQPAKGWRAPVRVARPLPVVVPSAAYQARTCHLGFWMSTVQDIWPVDMGPPDGSLRSPW
jgi:hypothetical protein